MLVRTKSLRPKLSRMQQADGSYLWEFDLDFSRVPIGIDTEVILEGAIVSEMAEHSADEDSFKFTIR